MDLQNYLKTNFEKAKEGNWTFDEFLSKSDSYEIWLQEKQDDLIKEQQALKDELVNKQHNKNLEEAIMTILDVLNQTFEEVVKTLDKVDLDLDKTQMESDEELYAIEKENYVLRRNDILLKNKFTQKKTSLGFNNVQVFENTFYDDFTNKDKTVELIFKSDEPNLLVLNTMSYDIASRYIKSNSEHLLAYLDVDNLELLENMLQNIV